VLSAVSLVAAAGVSRGQPGLEQALRDSRIQGGLCVVLGSADAELAARIANAGPFLVHCLAADGAKVAAARQTLLARGLYGRVSVEAWHGRDLPYADNLVSLLIVLEGGMAGEAERLRVLRPGGQMIIRQAGGFAATTKPRPAGKDSVRALDADSGRLICLGAK
jgi:hypothetical protein